MPEIIHTNWGIAYAFRKNNKDIIEINKKLLQHPELYKEILEHEKQHLKNPSFLDTLKIDSFDVIDLKKQKYLSKILRKEPLMGIQSIIPIWWQDKQICYNPFLLFIYSMLSIPLILLFLIL